MVPTPITKKFIIGNNRLANYKPLYTGTNPSPTLPSAPSNYVEYIEGPAYGQRLWTGTAFEGNPSVTDGTLPATVYCLAVEFVSMLGTATTVSVSVRGEIFAVLDPGQSIVIPMEMGEAIADCQIHAGHYTDGSREATVNVLVAGQ